MIEALLAVTVVWLISKRLSNGVVYTYSTTYMNDASIQSTVNTKELQRVSGQPFEAFEGLPMSIVPPIVPDDEHELFQPLFLQQGRVQPRAPMREIPPWL
jgi:hypothetical protein